MAAPPGVTEHTTKLLNESQDHQQTLHGARRQTVSGQDMVIAGIVVAAGSLTLYVMRGRIGLGPIAYIMIAVVLLCVLGMVIHGYTVLRRI